MTPLRLLAAAAGVFALTACSDRSPLTDPTTDGLTSVSAKSAKAGASSIAVQTVAAGVISPDYQQLELGIDAQGRSFWVEEIPTGTDATGEPVGSAVLHVVALDTATVRTTIRTIRQRIGWVAEVPKTATYDNKAARVTWRRGKLAVTISVLHEPGRTVQDHGIVR